MQVINWRLISHPMNWVTVFLMVFVASVAITLILDAFSSPETA